MEQTFPCPLLIRNSISFPCPALQIHIHFSDGTSMNYDGSIHDKMHGTPNITCPIEKWLQKNGWR